MDDMMEELIDRFGDIPKKVQQLLHIAALKGLAHSAYVTAVEQKGADIRFTMYEKAKIDPQKIPGMLAGYGKDSCVPDRGASVFFFTGSLGKAEKIPGRACLTRCAECWRISGE